MMEEDVAQAKKALRHKARRLRDAMPAGAQKAADATIRGHVLELPAFRAAGTVLSYLSFGSEVDTRGIIEAAWGSGKVVALPRCASTRQMRWFRVEGFDALEPSPFGVLEPLADPATEVLPSTCVDAVALVPGLMFDDGGFRLGYGGGYYDAFLSSFHGMTVGICRSALLSPDPLPREAHDLPVDLVVTDAP